MVKRIKRANVTHNGKKAVLSLADVPFPMGQGLELMLMDSYGKEIEVSYPESIEHGIAAFDTALAMYQ